ncbi:MAG: hypothetical protein KAG14_02205, partial [Mycoplasmataceae bacterium]|nr:hypothetical protein [Mycoplasmataceae bacterium]
MKKALLGLGSILAVVTPIVSVVACGGNDKDGQEDNTKGQPGSIPILVTQETPQPVVPVVQKNPILVTQETPHVINNNISFEIPDKYNKSRTEYHPLPENTPAVMVLDRRTGKKLVYSTGPGSTFLELLKKYGWLTGHLTDGILNLSFVNSNNVETPFTTDARTLVNLMTQNTLQTGASVPSILNNRNIFKRNFTDENIYTNVLTKGFDFDVVDFEASMKSMFSGNPTVTGWWDKPLQHNVSGVYTYTVVAISGTDATEVKYRIRVYDSIHDQGKVLSEALKRLKTIVKAHKDPFSDTALDKYQYVSSPGDTTSWTQDKLELKLAISKLIGSTNFHFLSPSISGMFKDPTKRYSENKGWELSFKNIAVILYAAYGLNISLLPNDKMEEIKAATIKGEVDISKQDEVDKFFDKSYGSEKLSRDAWKDHEHVGPFNYFDKFVEAVIKISNFSPSELQSHKFSTSKIKNNKLIFALNTFWSSGINATKIIDIDDSIKFIRNVDAIGDGWQ